MLARLRGLNCQHRVKRTHLFDKKILFSIFSIWRKVKNFSEKLPSVTIFQEKHFLLFYPERVFSIFHLLFDIHSMGIETTIKSKHTGTLKLKNQLQTKIQTVPKKTVKGRDLKKSRFCQVYSRSDRTLFARKSISRHVKHFSQLSKTKDQKLKKLSLLTSERSNITVC